MPDITLLPLDGVVLGRMVRAVELVRERLLKATRALEAGGVPYAVIGGNAVAVWVARVDVAAVRNTAEVDILIARSDLERTKEVLEAAGFLYHETLDVHMFLDGPQARPREAVHILFAEEKVQADYVAATPAISESVVGEQYRILSLEALVRMKLTSFRLKDQVHLQDLIGVGLIDSTWPARFQPELAARLQQILDNPNG
ncbi:MAG: hypothetical protein AB7V46_07835 [Thermomicrobiales bacterium]